MVICSFIIGCLCINAAVQDHGYGFYEALRWAVTAGALGVAFGTCRAPVRACFALVALLFNPIVPFELGRGAWQVIDWLVGLGLVAWGVNRWRLALLAWLEAQTPSLPRKMLA